MSSGNAYHVAGRMLGANQVRVLRRMEHSALSLDGLDRIDGNSVTSLEKHGLCLREAGEARISPRGLQTVEAARDLDIPDRSENPSAAVGETEKRHRPDGPEPLASKRIIPERAAAATSPRAPAAPTPIPRKATETSKVEAAQSSRRDIRERPNAPASPDARLRVRQRIGEDEIEVEGSPKFVASSIAAWTKFREERTLIDATRLPKLDAYQLYALLSALECQLEVTEDFFSDEPSLRNGVELKTLRKFVPEFRRKVCDAISKVTTTQVRR